MDTADLLQSGRSQAVRLPIDDPWQTLETGLAVFETGFVITREQPEEPIREAISP